MCLLQFKQHNDVWMMNCTQPDALTLTDEHIWIDNTLSVGVADLQRGNVCGGKELIWGGESHVSSECSYIRPLTKRAAGLQGFNIKVLSTATLEGVVK